MSTEEQKNETVKEKKTKVNAYLIIVRVAALLIFFVWLLAPKYERYMFSPDEDYDDIHWRIERQCWRAPAYIIIDYYNPVNKHSERKIYLYPYSYMFTLDVVEADIKNNIAFMTIDL